MRAAHSDQGQIVIFAISVDCLGLCLSIDPFSNTGGERKYERESYSPVKSDFITALRIIYREGLSVAFAHLSMRSSDGNEMMFMPRKTVK